MLFFSYLTHKAVKQSIIVLLWFCVPTEKPVSSLRFNLFCHQYILWLVFTYIFLNKWNDNLYLKNVSLNWASFYKIQKSYVLKKRILLIRSVPYCLTPNSQLPSILQRNTAVTAKGFSASTTGGMMSAYQSDASVTKDDSHHHI